jgi:peptide/nickel transport system permease protein
MDRKTDKTNDGLDPTPEGRGSHWRDGASEDGTVRGADFRGVDPYVAPNAPPAGPGADAATLPPVNRTDDGRMAGRLEEEEASVYVASQWKLMWWRFRRHRLALLSAILVLLIYSVAVFAEVLAPVDPDARNGDYTYAPPQRLHFFGNENGFGPYVYGYRTERDPDTLALTYEVDPSTQIPVRFFDTGAPYELWGLIPANVHLIGPVDDGQPMYLLGANETGQDLLSRLIYGTRVSMSIGLVGVFLSFVLGIVLGGISGYFGGLIDTVIQRVQELLLSIPSIPLWMGLAAALPAYWPPLRLYFGITIILSIIGWVSLARVVRGRFLSLREEDFVMAARLDGSSRMRVILRHMLPSFASHIIAALTLAIPAMILAETALSFLGLGLSAPVESWGVLLQEAQNVRVVATAPWLLIPGLAVFVAVLALNFTGDGLRDAADPYA